MSIQFNIQNGSLTPSGSTLTRGCSFEWMNPTGQDVTISGCSAFATQDSYQVPKKSANGGSGLASVTLKTSIAIQSYTFSETPNEWNAPGTPRITIVAMDREAKDVA